MHLGHASIRLNSIFILLNAVPKLSKVRSGYNGDTSQMIVFNCFLDPIPQFAVHGEYRIHWVTDWFPVNERTDSWPDGRQSVRFG